jgi:glycosyltransferase involved in cell wall biosynthesis
MISTFEQTAATFLRKNIRFYDGVVAHALRIEPYGDDEATMRWIGLAAEIAWAAHPGRLSDGRLEAMAMRIGQRLAMPAENAQGSEASRRGKGSRHVLHVATAVLGTGGHTRLLENWIKTDDASRHSLLLLDQEYEPIRVTLTDRIADSGGELIIIPHGTLLLERARQLRLAARSGYDVVVLHHHPNDVTPLVAFATEGGPPVAIMNHADHIFWLGVSIADLVIEYRNFGAKLSEERRGTRASVMFPLPLDIQSSSPTRAEARAHLNIPEAEQMLLSIGPATKYMPTKRQRFFDTASKVLERHCDTRLYVIGVGESDRKVLNIPSHPRMALLGIVKDPTYYEAAADLYLEGFPFGSYTALLETAARGVCPVVMHSPTAHNEAACEVALLGLVESAKDEDDYLAEIATLLVDREMRTRRGQDIARRIESHHGTVVSRRYLDNVYFALAGLRHSVAVLPACQAQVGRHDLDLAGFQSSRMKIPVAEWVSTATVRKLSFAEWFWLFRISVAAGDTQVNLRHAKAWLSMLKRKILHNDDT